MADGIVLVTGVPAAGKSTVATALAAALPAEFLSLDDIKEAMFESDPAVGNSVELRFAAEAELWERIARATGTVVIDIWVAPGRDDERVAAALARYASVVQVVCRVSADVAVNRYVDRVRSGPHQPPDQPTLQRIRDAVAAFVPLDLGPSIDLDTEHDLDASQLATDVRALLAATDQPERPRQDSNL